MRRSLYVKDDDYRLSFLYGNFTTLTRFTELDLERVLTERLSPLYVSIHATDPEVRAAAAAQPPRRDEPALAGVPSRRRDRGPRPDRRLPGRERRGRRSRTRWPAILERYPRLATVGVVPLGVSRFSNEATMRAHTADEAAAVLDYRRRRGRSASPGRSGAGSSSPPTSTTCSPGGPSRRPRPTRASPSTRTASGWRAAFAEAFAAGAGRPSGRAGGFFRSVDGAPGPRLPGAARRRPGRRGVRRGRLRRRTSGR